MLRDLCKEILKIIIGLQVVRLRSLRYAIDDRTGLRSGNRIDHHPVLLPYTEPPDGLLCCIVMHRYFSIIQKYLQVFFLVQAVMEPFPCLPFPGDTADILFYSFEIRLHQWADAHLSALFPFFCRQLPQLFSFPEDCLYHGQRKVRKAVFLFRFWQNFYRFVKPSPYVAPAPRDPQILPLVLKRMVYLIAIRDADTAEPFQEFPRMAGIARLLVFIQDDPLVFVHLPRTVDPHIMWVVT